MISQTFLQNGLMLESQTKRPGPQLLGWGRAQIWPIKQDHRLQSQCHPQAPPTPTHPCGRSPSSGLTPKTGVIEVILNQKQCCSPGDSWQCLTTFLTVSTRGGGCHRQASEMLLNILQCTESPHSEDSSGSTKDRQHQGRGPLRCWKNAMWTELEEWGLPEELRYPGWPQNQSSALPWGLGSPWARKEDYTHQPASPPQGKT